VFWGSFEREDAYACIFEAGGAELRIQKVGSLTPQAHALLGWSVASVDEVVTSLASKGVSLERHRFLGQDIHGIWTSPSGAKVAWIKDPDGNLLSVTEPPPHMAKCPQLPPAAWAGGQLRSTLTLAGSLGDA